MRHFIIIQLIFLFVNLGKAQESNFTYEIGAEIQAASFSNHGGSFGGALKFAFVQEEAVVFGPSFRFQYIWSKNLYLGTEGKSFTTGGGGFFHYRFLEWFFLGTEIEILRNPYTQNYPDKKWMLTAFLGGGLSKNFGPVILNVGILYDVADGLRSPYESNPSPLSQDYFIRVTNPKKPNYGRYIPIIYRIAFFFPLNRDKNEG